MLHKKVARVKGLDRLIQPSQSSEDKLLNQVQMLGAGVNRSRMNDPHWMAWVRGALLRQQVTLKAWLVVQGQFDIHLQIDDPKVFSGLVAQVEEFSWQMVEFNTSGEVMNVVIRAPAVD